MLYVATERPSWLLIGLALFLGRRVPGLPRCSATCSARVDVWLHAFAPATSTAPTSSCRACSAWRSGGLLGTRPRARAGRTIVPYAQTDFIVAAIGEELGLTGLMAMLILYAIVVQRGLRTAIVVPRLVRQAARRRPRLQRGAAGVRRRRRRHPADPADRPDHAVPVLRRLVAGRQLGASSRCCCGSATTRGARRRTCRARRRWTTPRPRW